MARGTVPDRFGNVLPQGLTGGQVWLGTSDPEGGAILYDVPSVLPYEFIVGSVFGIDTVTGAQWVLAAVSQVVEAVGEFRTQLVATQLALRGATQDD